MSELTASDFAAQPHIDKLVVLDIETARALEGETWTSYSADTYYISFTDGEVVRVVVDGAALSEVFSAANCDTTESSFFVDLDNQRLYVHASGGNDPGGGSYASVMAFFFIGLANAGVSLRRCRQMLIDGKLDRWDSASTLTYWTEDNSGTAALARESSEVYDRFSAYSAKMTVGAVASWQYIYQDITLRPSGAATIRLKYKCGNGGSAPYVRFYDTGANQYLTSGGGWSGSQTNILISNSTAWTEWSISFSAHASYSNYRLMLLAQTDGDEIYWDNIEVLRFYEPGFFLPYLSEAAIPSISHSVGTFANPEDQLSFGSITLNDDGYFANTFSRFQWHNKNAWIKVGFKTSTYDELAPMFLGLTRNPTLSDGRFRLDIQDARAEFKDLLQASFDTANASYANCENIWKEKPMPLLLGHLHGIQPPCSNETGMDSFTVSQINIGGNNYALADINAVYVGPRTNGRIENAWWAENLSHPIGGFSLLRNREGQWVKCDATGYYSNWIDWLWFVFTEINGTNENDINYRSFLDLATARANITLVRWYGDQINVKEMINQFKRSAQFFFYTRRTGEFCARALNSTVPSDTPVFFNEDLSQFETSQNTAEIYGIVSMRYHEQSAPESEKFAKITSNEANYEHGAKESIAIDMMETTDAVANNMANYYAGILSKPLETVRVTLPASAMFIDPTDKIYLSKSVVDNNGTTQDIYSNQVFVVLGIEKDLNAFQATVTAVKSENAFYWTE